MAKDETKVQASDVEAEHLREVNAALQAAYGAAVIAVSFGLMVALIALLGASA